MKNWSLTFFLALTFTFLQGQKTCFFTTMSDTAICSPGVVELYVKGGNLDKVKWQGPNITSNDTLYKISAQIDSTTTFYVSNRISDPNNLIVNGDFESGDVSFSSDYSPSCLNGQMPQGTYCIHDNPDDYWPSWRPCGDHTTGSGKMYITDGAVVVDEKIWCQSVNVTQNTDYEFSAWLTTVLNLNNAILQFSINDTPIGSPFQAASEECEWNEFFQIWNSGINTTAEICITNQNTAGDGNDFAIDDIRFNEVCYSEDSVTIKVVEEVKVKINNDTAICPGDDFIISNKTPQPFDYKFKWSSSETSESILYNKTGQVQLEVSSPEGCTGSDTMIISRIPDPVSSLIGDTAICFSIFGELELMAGEASETEWIFEGISSTSNSFFATKPGVYEVKLSNGDNCFVTDRVQIDDFCSTHLFFPNSFTPNNDGLNDTFGGEALATYDYNLKIFNRWGKVVFESNDLNVRWDGHNAPQGVYTYFSIYTIADPEGGTLKENKKVGSVTLIR